LLAAVLIAALAGYDRLTYRPSATGDASRYQQQTARVTYIADGDTFDVDIPDGTKATTRIRLWGVDTPEIGGTGGPMHFAKEAKVFAEEALSGKEVLLSVVPDDTRDRYGRLLAFVYLSPDGSMFNELLIERGFAYADTRFPHEFRGRFLQLEEHARSERVGLWQSASLVDMPKWKQKIEKRRKGRAD